MGSGSSTRWEEPFERAASHSRKGDAGPVAVAVAAGDEDQAIVGAVGVGDHALHGGADVADRGGPVIHRIRTESGPARPGTRRAGRIRRRAADRCGRRPGRPTGAPGEAEAGEEVVPRGGVLVA